MFILKVSISTYNIRAEKFRLLHFFFDSGFFDKIFNKSI